MSLFTIQTVQKYREAIGDALMQIYFFVDCRKSEITQYLKKEKKKRKERDGTHEIGRAHV